VGKKGFREQLEKLDEAAGIRELAPLIEQLGRVGEAARIRVLARLIALTFGHAKLAMKASNAALQAMSTAVDVSNSLLKQGQVVPEAASKAAKGLEAAKQALQTAQAAVKAADSLEPGRKRMEEHMSKLTRREKQVYLLLARGKTDKEIAKELGKTPRLAQMHVTNIKKKLGIIDRDAFILPFPLLS
jgi:DNA-binding CsgD family transcriptional regulator